MENKIVIYNSPNANVHLNIKFDGSNFWLTQDEIAELFGVKRPAITKHINNIFSSKELKENSVCSKMELTARDGKRYKTKMYNLDMVISVGYRVNSILATNFRMWATKTLKKFLMKGYVINRKMLKKQSEYFEELKKSVDFISSKSNSAQLRGEVDSLLSLISEYTNSIYLLSKYDNNGLKVGGKLSTKEHFILTYSDVKDFIDKIKSNYSKKLSKFFGIENSKKLEGIVGGINQTFDGKYLYKSIEEKAANLLYLVIKDHPFVDGNKRIGSTLFVYYLSQNKLLNTKNGERKINDRALVALALLIAVSEPNEKNTLIKLVVNLIK